MTSTPAGSHLSPGLSSRRMVLAGRVLKYSASSTWVPSLSSTSLTGSPMDTPSFSLPLCTSSSRLPTTSPFRTLRLPSHNLKGLFPRDSCNTPITFIPSNFETVGRRPSFRATLSPTSPRNLTYSTLAVYSTPSTLCPHIRAGCGSAPKPAQSYWTERNECIR